MLGFPVQGVFFVDMNKGVHLKACQLSSSRCRDDLCVGVPFFLLRIRPGETCPM